MPNVASVTPRLIAIAPSQNPSLRSNASPHRGQRSGIVNQPRNRRPCPQRGQRFTDPRANARVADTVAVTAPRRPPG